MLSGVSLSRKRKLSDPPHSSSEPKKLPFPAVASLYNLDPAATGPQQIELRRKVCLRVGRSKKNDIILTPADCSTYHCEIGVSYLNGKDIIYLKDLSSNGTFVNGLLVGKDNTCLIRSGDKISFAAECHYVMKYQASFTLKSPRRPGTGSFYDSYVIGELLGCGHYAQVKECVRRSTGECCAVKIFNPTRKDANWATSLNRELNILMKIDHPNIVRSYETFVEPYDANTMTTYLVLEKVNGGELFNRIVSKGKLRQNETKALMSQLMSGLKYLHSLDIAHRDLKPENILLDITLRNSDSDKQTGPWDAHELDVKVKIADFGLAKFIGATKFTNTLCGTPAYVAPEVLVNSTERKYTKTVDMWSVGVLIYVCLCGFPPFSEELGPPSMRQQIIEGKYAFYSPYWDEIEDSALDLISRLLVVDATKRLEVSKASKHAWFDEVRPKKELRETAFKGSRAPVTRGYSNPIMLAERVKSSLGDDTLARAYSADVDMVKPT
ncbi:hypothetical protein KL935_002893 [Ogataea polymorpha]|nr:hypothetical protein KL937_003002 [Ogataea polymorpha]KAG7888519.1 hypothetical protein KL936_003731 [Ogataea polymorpha]KAG7892305.1 hypothetical protein KL908_003257 [Ogataea polymorpha]KAG7900150.1 hypothetical protein KL935_002893 [Ogataea polymorpha]KAG7916187.1 hypothetical protein KL927_003652 [Ogataea polymorpha]